MISGSARFSLRTEDALRRLEEDGPWDVLVTGTRPGLELEEERFRALPECALPRRTMHFFRTAEDQAHIFSIGMNDGREKEAVPWSEVRNIVENLLGRGPGKVIIDITALELESLLYLFPALVRLGPKRLFAGYVIPEVYSLNGNPDIWIRSAREIQQPKGYGTIPPSLKEGQATRVLILGFDEGRAYKFIQKYNWPQQEIWAVIGDPAYALDGVKTVESHSEPVLKAIKRHNPAQIARIPAHDPLAMRDFLQQRLSAVHHLDIIPLGPKPLVLGALLFYFGLLDSVIRDISQVPAMRIPKASRDKSLVRFLYDFPVPRARKSHGMRDLYLYDCDILL